MNPVRLDHEVIHFLRKIFVPFARIAIFIVYFWFGILKLLNFSPAEPLVQQLFTTTIHFMQFHTFYVLFALFEMIIGILFLFPKAVRVAIPLLLIHMIMTILPLFLLPQATWQGFLIPTLTGQYIIKNLVIIGIALGIASYTHPIPWRH